MTDTVKLEQSAELFIGAFAQDILRDVAVFQRLHNIEPEILTLIAELRMDVKFVLMDLSTSLIAAYKSKAPYACRYHIKNLYAGMQEAYKLLLGYGKSQRYTIWTKMGMAINSKPVSTFVEYHKLEDSFQHVSEKLRELAGDDADKMHRDLTYHYNADMKQVYLYTIAAYNMEEAGNKFISYMDLLAKMLKLCDEIEDCLCKNGVCKSLEIEHASIDNSIHLKLIKYLLKNKNIFVAIDGILNDVKPIDDYAFHLEKFHELKEKVGDKFELPEIDNVFVLINMYLTVLFMRADMAAITQSFLLSKTSGEAMLNMRRYVITVTAALSHLYGYSKEERSKSIWSAILCMIPKDVECLNKKSIQIDELFQKVVLSKDMDARTCYSHLYDNETRKTNIPAVLDLLKKQNPILELQKVTLMLKVTKVVMDFMKDVMEELSIRARQANEKSTAELRNIILKVRELTDQPNCPVDLKEKLSDMMGDIQRMTGIEL